MKKIFISLLLLAVAHIAVAQTTLVATLLYPGGSLYGTYYGANALKQAYEAADHGFTIVLSPGQFNSAITIEKLITIRGAGMCAVPEKNVQPTILNGSITFKYGLSTTIWDEYPDYRLKMEGICTRDAVAFANNGGLLDAQFTKCCFGDFKKTESTSQYRWENVSFVDCYMLGETYVPGESSVAFYNCILKHLRSEKSNSTVTVDNCVFFNSGNGSSGHAVEQGSARNTFFIHNTSYPNSWFPKNTFVCEHCYSTIPDYFRDQTGNTNTVVNKNISDIFLRFDGENWKDGYNYYELTDWAKYNMLGSDGSQMSIYGGTAAPFNPLTSAPQITSFSAPESTSNGILRVNIQVEVPQ